MAKTIKKAYTDNPTAGDDLTTEGYMPYDDGDGTAKSRSDIQLANVIAVRLDLEGPATPGDTTAPTITSFIATPTQDSLTVDISMITNDLVGVTGYIIKEDDASLPGPTDSDWDSTEPTTLLASSYGTHEYTLRTRDDALNVSNPFTISVTLTQTTAATITSFTTTNPDTGSSDYTFSLAVSGTATHYKPVYNSNTPALAGDSGWVDETGNFPLSGETATLDSFVDSTVYMYVKNGASGTVSPAATSFVDVTLGGDTASNGDWLWANDPSTIVAYDGSRSFTGSGALVIDGTSSNKGELDGTGLGTTALIKIESSATYSSIEIINMHLFEGEGPLLYIDGTNLQSGCTISIRNNKFGASNTAGTIDSNQKNAIYAINCNACVFTIFGNYFDKPDGGIHLQNCDNSSMSVRHNWVSYFVSRAGAAINNSYKFLNFVTSRAGWVSGDITENIIYDPTGAGDIEDILNINQFRGTISTSFDITRNRFFAPSNGSGAAVQIGDGENVVYVHVDENTFIGCNNYGQFSSGSFCKFINNKGYTPEDLPATGLGGYVFQVYRIDVDPGEMHDHTLENNTFLQYYDKEDGSPLITDRGIFYPSYGKDSLNVKASPNHGECVGTCDSADNVAPTGYSNNNTEYSAWAGNAGLADLWRNSWSAFVYAGADGDTPTISYDSPSVLDGGSQSFSAANVTLTAFGDGADTGDIQTHDVKSLAIGGVAPYTIASVTAVTNCTVSNNTTNVVWTAGSTDGGAFTYQYTLEDSTGAQATGTVTGTLSTTAATVRYYDQDGADYVSITLDHETPTMHVGENYDYYPRNSNEWLEFTGNSSPNNTYMRSDPYSGVQSDDTLIETLSAEMVFRIHCDQTATYTIWIKGAGTTTNYNDIWMGVDNVVAGDRHHVTANASITWEWDDGDRGSGAATFALTAGQEYDINVWRYDGGFLLGKIVVAIASYTPTGDGPAESALASY